MKKSTSSRTSRQTKQGRSTGSRDPKRSQRTSRTSQDSTYGNSGRGSGGRVYDEDGRYSSDDGGYYSNRNLSGRGSRSQMGGYGYRDGRSENWGEYDDSRRSGATFGDWDNDDYTSDPYYEGSEFGRRSQSQRSAPYRSSEQDYESGSRGDRDRFGESNWNRPEGGQRFEPSQSSRRGQEDFGWGGRMSRRDDEMGYNAGRLDEDYYGEREGIAGGRYTRYADVDEVEGQYDEDYRDRDSYNYSRRGLNPNSRSSSGYRR